MYPFTLSLYFSDPSSQVTYSQSHLSFIPYFKPNILSQTHYVYFEEERVATLYQHYITPWWEIKIKNPDLIVKCIPLPYPFTLVTPPYLLLIPNHIYLLFRAIALIFFPKPIIFILKWRELQLSTNIILHLDEKKGGGRGRTQGATKFLITTHIVHVNLSLLKF